MNVFRFLFTVGYWLFFLVTAIAGFVILCLVFAASAPLDPDRRAVHAFLCRYSHAYLHLNPGWRVRVDGRALLPRGPSVIVTNHQSMADVIVCMGLGHQFKFVSKASLFSVPIVGWSMWMAKYVRVERGRAHSMKRMMEDCRAWLRRGMSVLLFPEGTYGPGGRLLPFKRGAFQLAVEERVPVVPVVIEGTPGLVHDDGPWLSPTGRIRMTVLPPIDVAALGDDAAALAARVRRMFAERLGYPDEQGAPPAAERNPTVQ